MVTLISPSKCGAALIKYLLDGPGHDGSEERYICTETIGLMPSCDSRGYLQQFDHEWDKMSCRHKVQMRHIIISPSEKEIPYKRSNAPLFAQLVKDYIMEHYPNRRALIVIQQDGAGYVDNTGKQKRILHAHVALSDADIYDYKGVETEKTCFKYLSKTFDEFVTNHGITIDPGKDLSRRRHLNKQLITEGERDEEGKFFSYQDDIKNRINLCINMSESIDDFYSKLGDFGLSVAQKQKKKTGEIYQTYYLHDLSNISDLSKDKNGSLKKLAKKDQLPGMRSYRQDGFSIEDIEYMIRNKITEQKENIQYEPELTTTIEETAVTPIISIPVTEDQINNNTDKKKEPDQKQKELAYQRYLIAKSELSVDLIQKQSSLSL